MNTPRTLTIAVAIMIILTAAIAEAGPQKAVPDRSSPASKTITPRTRDVPPLSAEVLTVHVQGSIDPNTNIVNHLTIIVVRHIDPRPDHPVFDPSQPHVFALVNPHNKVAKGDIVQLERLPVPETFSFQTNPDKAETRKTRPIYYVAYVITSQVVLR